MNYLIQGNAQTGIKCKPSEGSVNRPRFSLAKKAFSIVNGKLQNDCFILFHAFMLL